MVRIPKIFFQSLDPEQHKERDFYYDSLKSEERAVQLTDNPSTADWILLTDIFNLDQFDQIPHHSLVKKYPEKVLIITESDQPIEVWPGLYTSGLKMKTDKRLVNGWFYPYFRVRFPNNTILQIKNPEPLEKKYLASFVGYPSHIIRIKLNKIWKDHPDINISVAKGYHHFATENKISAETAQMNFLNTLRSSHFSLCPRGRGPSSIRLFESMQLGIAPVIISDNWLPPSFIHWESCSVIIKENQIKEIDAILNPLKGQSEEMGRNARNIFLEYFSPECLGKSVNLALGNLAESVDGNWKPNCVKYHSTRLNRKFRFKFDYYKALMYNAIERVR